jgi:tRNA-splicing ligase RtcB
MTWKTAAVRHEAGYYTLATKDIPVAAEVRLFLTPDLLLHLEENLYPQIVNAARFPGVRLVAITPDAHFGYGVPVGCVILTDSATGAVAMGPVGYDIGCGMVSARSDVPSGAATPDRRLAFNREVTERIAMGAGEHSKTRMARIGEREFQRIIRGGAEYYTRTYGDRVDRGKAERDVIPVDDGWDFPRGGLGRPERGIPQIGSLGGGNHFIELQRSEQADTLFVQIHTGSRGFGHGMATTYFHLAKSENQAIQSLDLAYFTPESEHYHSYLNAVAAGANFAIVNRLVIFEQVATAFEAVFDAPLELVYEISHNLVQTEDHPEYGLVNVHRKGATRALPAGHPQLTGTQWADTGHPVLIPGSNQDYSYILRPLPGAAASGFSVNHGAGRRMSRAAAKRELHQATVDGDYRAAGIVVNLDGRVPIDESGACYKSSRAVIGAVTGAGLAEIEHELWPLASLKGG